MALVRAALPLLPLLGACVSAPRLEPGWQSVQLCAGSHGLDEDSWEPLDSRALVALTWSRRAQGWPCGMELGLQYAHAENDEGDETVAKDADFLDLRFGASAEWRPVRWLLLEGGAGPRLALVEVKRLGNFNVVTDNGGSLGVFAHAGAFVVVHGGFSAGLEGQWADGSDYDVNDVSRSAAAAEVLLALRWNF